MSYNVMKNFLIDQGFDERKAYFITNYANLFQMFDVLDLKDLATKIPIEKQNIFWSGLRGTRKHIFKMLIAWAKEEFRIRQICEASKRWDGVAKVNIEEFARQWREENIEENIQNPFLV